LNDKETAKVMRPFGHRVNHSVLMVMHLFIADSVQVMSSYCDVVVIRHPQPGAVQVSHLCLSTVCLLLGFCHSVSLRSVGQSASRLVGQSVSRPVSQSVTAVSQSDGQPVGQLVHLSKQ